MARREECCSGTRVLAQVKARDRNFVEHANCQQLGEITHCTSWPNEFTGFAVVWPQACSLPWMGQRFVFFTTMLLNGPWKLGEVGSRLAVSRKQRPHASPGPTSGGAPKASWFIADVKPLAGTPHAVGVRYSACALTWSATRDAYQDGRSPSKT